MGKLCYKLVYGKMKKQALSQNEKASSIPRGIELVFL